MPRRPSSPGVAADRLAQGVLDVPAALLGGGDDGEQPLPQLLRAGRGQLGRLGRRQPGPAGPPDQRGTPGGGRLRAGDALGRRAPLLLRLLDLLPAGLDLRDVPRARVAEHVRVPADQLVDQVAGDVVDVEPAVRRRPRRPPGRGRRPAAGRRRAPRASRPRRRRRSRRRPRAPPRAGSRAARRASARRPRGSRPGERSRSITATTSSSRAPGGSGAPSTTATPGTGSLGGRRGTTTSSGASAAAASATSATSQPSARSAAAVGRGTGQGGQRPLRRQTPASRRGPAGPAAGG